jgi:hypothetical protein
MPPTPLPPQKKKEKEKQEMHCGAFIYLKKKFGDIIVIDHHNRQNLIHVLDRDIP